MLLVTLVLSLSLGQLSRIVEGPPKVSPLDVGPLEGGTFELSPSELGPGEICSLEVGSGEISLVTTNYVIGGSGRIQSIDDIRTSRPWSKP